jgi:hypothetical protein
MFQNRRIGLAFAIVVGLGAVVTYATGRALAAPTCTGCDIVTKVCATNNTGTCTDSPCYQYTNSSQSCWVCGTGSPGGGQCSAGDAALVCQSGSAQIQYQVYQVCTNVCWTNCRAQLDANVRDGDSIRLHRRRWLNTPGGGDPSAEFTEADVADLLAVSRPTACDQLAGGLYHRPVHWLEGSRSASRAQFRAALDARSWIKSRGRSGPMSSRRVRVPFSVDRPR